MGGHKRKSDRRSRESKARKAARKKATLASVEAAKQRKYLDNNDGGAPPEMEVAPAMNNDSVDAVVETVFVDVEAVAGCSSSGQRNEFSATVERLAGKPDSLESGSSGRCADSESSDSDRTEPLDVLQLGSEEEQATSVPPEVPALAEMELDGASRLPLPSVWASMDFDNPPSPPSSRKPGPKSWKLAELAVSAGPSRNKRPREVVRAIYSSSDEEDEAIDGERRQLFPGQEQTKAREEVAEEEALEDNEIRKRPVRGKKKQVSYAEPKRVRSCKSKKDQPAMPSTDIAASNAEVTRHFALRKSGLTSDALRTRSARKPNVQGKRVNSIRARLHMQQRAGERLLEQAQAVNQHWYEVTAWRDGETRVPRSVPRLWRTEFIGEEPGTQRSVFGVSKSRPMDYFLKMLGRTEPRDGGNSTVTMIYNATNESIRDRYDFVKDPKGEKMPKPKIRGKASGVRATFDRDSDEYISRSELISFLGIQFLISYHRLPELSMFWEQQPDAGLGLGIVQQSMTRDRFRFISKYLAVAIESDGEPPRPGEARDPIAKIRPLVIALNDRYTHCRMPGEVQSIDESMVKFKGRSMIRQSVRNKPIKSGFKLWSRCGPSGYTYQFEVYTGKTAAGLATSRKGESPGNIVLRLCDSLVDKGHIVAFDSYFTSVNLMDELEKRGINAVGTINKLRLNQPVMDELSLKQGQFRGKFSNEEPRKGLFIWKDTRAFRVISNYHGAETVDVERTQRDGSKKWVKCPLAMADYNQYMGGVDTANHLRSLYERDRRSKKWWHRLFYALLETTLVNSWICFNEVAEDPVALLEFKRSVTLGLLTTGLNPGLDTASRAARLTVVKPSGEAGAKRRKGRLSVRDEIRFHDVGSHRPVWSPTRLRCEFCSATTLKKGPHTDDSKPHPGLESRPFIKCERCGVHLCLSRVRNCFNLYHSATLYDSRAVAERKRQAEERRRSGEADHTERDEAGDAEEEAGEMEDLQIFHSPREGFECDELAE